MAAGIWRMQINPLGVRPSAKADESMSTMQIWWTWSAIGLLAAGLSG
jgi:hypothetical protein